MADEYLLFPLRTIEITVLSGEDLRMDRRPIKKNAFVVVRCSNDTNNFCTTEMDAGGGSYPMWNERLVLDFPAHAPALTVEVHCKTALGNRIVGAATVPVSDFSGGYVPQSYLHFLSYRLRDCKGERNGIINFSVRTKLPARAPAPEYLCSALLPSSSRPTVGVSVENKNNDFGGVVYGVPV